jgi:hypothetical protein
MLKALGVQLGLPMLQYTQRGNSAFKQKKYIEKNKGSDKESKCSN